MRPDLEAEFEDFVAAMTPRLFRAAYAITRDHHHAEDAVQSALGRVYAKWRSVSRADHPEAYARRVVVNEVLSWRRRRSWGEVPADELPDTGTASREAQVDTADAMWRAIGTLPPRQRAVVVLRYYEHLSEAEIAEVLGVRPGTVKSQSSAALASLRRHWELTMEGERV